MSDDAHFQRRALTATALGAAAAALLFLAWQLGPILLLLFAGTLLAVFLRALTHLTARVILISDTLAFTLVVFGMFALITTLLLFFLPVLAQGVDQITEDLPQAFERTARELQRYPWGRDLIARLERAQWDGITPGALSQLFGFFSTAFGALTGSFLVLITAIYLGAEPGVYVQGVIQLVPPGHRERAARVVDSLYTALVWWMAARLASMAVVGVLTWIALLLLHVPFATTLALIAALLSFIPNIGPLLAAIPAVMVGLGESVAIGGYVIFAYILIQTVETYAITPIIQRRAVDLPPATAMGFQIAFGALYGFLGLLLATPLALALIVMVKLLYVEPAYGERTALPGRKES